MADALTRLKTRLGDEAAAADPALLETLLDDAQETILGYTNRARMPTALVGAQVELALIAYNHTALFHSLLFALPALAGNAAGGAWRRIKRK